MTRPDPTPAAPTHSPDGPGDGAAGPPAADHLRRLAELVADGRVAFPPDLPAAERDRLAAAVRARLRDRLVGLIARAIAADLAAARAPHGG